MRIPREFQFYHFTDHNKSTLYTAKVKGNKCVVSWDKGHMESSSGQADYYIGRVEENIRLKRWLLLAVNNNREALSFLRKG